MRFVGVFTVSNSLKAEEKLIEAHWNLNADLYL